MARTDTLPHFLTDVADAIRTKTGSSDTIQASTFDTAIANIPSGGGGETDIYRVADYEDLPANANEGDLGVVYGNSINNIELNEDINNLYFPDEIVLSEPYEYEYLEANFNAGNADVRLEGSGTDLNFQYSDFDNNMQMSVSYTTEDYQTFTKGYQDGFDGDIMPFPEPIVLEYAEPEEFVLEFLKTQNLIFGGIYSYDATETEWVVADLGLTAEEGYVYNGKTYLGANGVEEGILGSIDYMAEDFNDLNAELLTDILMAYDTLTPKVVNSNTFNFNPKPSILPAKSDGTCLYDFTQLQTMERFFYGWSELRYVIGADFACNNLEHLFDNCSNLHAIINAKYTGNNFSLRCAFLGCSNLEYISPIDCTHISNDNLAVQSAFQGCRKLKNITLNNSSNLTSLWDTFKNCNALTTVKVDTSNVSNFKEAFFSCPALTTIIGLNTSNATTLESAFWLSPNLNITTPLDVSNCTVFTNAFCGNTQIVNFPFTNMRNDITSMSNCFGDCTNLEDVPYINASNLTSYGLQNAFKSCPNLTNESLNNILKMCSTYTNCPSNKKTLKFIGISAEQAVVCQSLSNYSLATSAGWTTGY